MLWLFINIYSIHFALLSESFSGCPCFYPSCTRSATRIFLLPILNRIFIYSRIFRNSLYPLLLLPTLHFPRRSSTLYSPLSSQDYPVVISSFDIRKNHLDSVSHSAQLYRFLLNFFPHLTVSSTIRSSYTTRPH